MDATSPSLLPSPLPDMRAAVEQTLQEMPWLGPTDAGLKALALRLAAEIQETADRADEFARLMVETDGEVSLHARVRKLETQCNVSKMVGWLGPQLKSVLADLGGNPAARKGLGETNKTGKRLSELRKAANEAAGQHHS